LLLLSIGLTIWVQMLRRMVAARTRELEAERQSVVNVINSIHDPVWLKDTQGRYLSCNRRLEEMYGHSQGEMIGKTDFQLLDDKVAAAFRASDQAAMAAGKTVAYESVVRNESTGMQEHVQTLKTPLLDAQGHPVAVLGIARDITALVKAR
ncbi:PAS domain-containing protein, partial [Arthrospira platensis SPKY1]|nr:PAS domain-containing protein [Arthrospira platensis SPKY1]